MNQNLLSAEFLAKRRKVNNAVRAKLSDVVFDMGKLVFGGVIIGGVFEHPEEPLYLYGSGVLAFVLLMWWGFYLYVKSVKEE